MTSSNPQFKGKIVCIQDLYPSADIERLMPKNPDDPNDVLASEHYLNFYIQQLRKRLPIKHGHTRIQQFSDQDLERHRAPSLVTRLDDSLSARTDRERDFFSPEKIRTPQELRSLAEKIRIDPTRLTPKFLKSLGWNELTPKRGDTAVDKALKEIKAARRLNGLLGGRIESIAANRQDAALSIGKRRIKNAVRIAENPFDDDDPLTGKILINKTVDDPNDNTKRQLVVTDAYKADRMYHHAEASMGSEHDLLAFMEFSLHTLLDEFSRDEPLSEHEAQQLLHLLILGVNRFKGVRATSKKALRAAFKKAIEKVQENPPESQEDIQSAISKHMGDRHRELYNMRRYTQGFRIDAKAFIKEDERSIREFVGMIETHGNRAKLFDPTGHLSPGNRRRTRQIINEQIDKAKTIRFAPNLQMARRFIAQAEVVDQLLQDENYMGNHAAVGREFKKLYLIGKLINVNMQLMEFYRHISLNSSSANPHEMEQWINDIESELRDEQEEPGKKGVGDNMRVNDFYDQYVEVYKLLDILKKEVQTLQEEDKTRTSPKAILEKELSKWLDDDSSPKLQETARRFIKKRISSQRKLTPKFGNTNARRKAYEKMKKTIAAFDFETLVTTLP